MAVSPATIPSSPGEYAGVVVLIFRPYARKTLHHRVTENTEKTRELSFCLLCDSVVSSSVLLRAIRDPGLDFGDFCLRKRRLWRHWLAALAGDRAVQPALVRLAGLHGFHDRVVRSHVVKPLLRPFGAMALAALLGQQRL